MYKESSTSLTMLNKQYTSTKLTTSLFSFIAYIRKFLHFKTYLKFTIYYKTNANLQLTTYNHTKTPQSCVSRAQDRYLQPFLRLLPHPHNHHLQTPPHYPPTMAYCSSHTSRLWMFLARWTFSTVSPCFTATPRPCICPFSAGLWPL
jgi:hypothetical protein